MEATGSDSFSERQESISQYGDITESYNYGDKQQKIDWEKEVKMCAILR